MKVNPILDAIRDSYVRHGHDTENHVFSMIMTKSVKDKVDFDNFNLGELVKTIHETSHKNSSLSFKENELVINNKYEIHSVSACRNSDGEPEVFIHMYNIATTEITSKRICDIMNLDFLFKVIEKINEKCELTFNIDEDDN